MMGFCLADCNGFCLRQLAVSIYLTLVQQCRIAVRTLPVAGFAVSGFSNSKINKYAPRNGTAPPNRLNMNLSAIHVLWEGKVVQFWNNHSGLELL